jgi:regulator of replication initiation timing
VQELRDRITTLRHENEQLRLHVELYEEHIRRLTIENTRLTDELARHAAVGHLANHRPRPTFR